MTCSRQAAWLTLALASALGGCEGVQSALAPQGAEAGRIAVLFNILMVGATVIFVGVIALTAVAIFGGARWRGWIGREAVVIGGGIVFPIVTLTALLGHSLVLMRAGGAAADADDALEIAVVGEMWWWRVIYTGPDGRQFESANELRIPVGQPARVKLSSADVIHSFWVPSLAGKLDMIPGRTNVLTLVADKPGISRGQCAEYCGGAHALMSFFVVALLPEEFEAWFAREAAPAAPPADTTAEEGQRLFLLSGCGACHAVRGTPAAGSIGPDLTHVGGRLSLAAATLEMNRSALMRWIVDNQHIKPENRMPPFRIFAEPELAAISTYLEGLR